MDLYRSKTLAVRARLGRGSSLCFVVFDPMGYDPSLDRQAFGETFFATYGYDAIHILSTSNNWYQDAGLPDALDLVRGATSAYDRVVTYGSSMGGYAALRFSGQVGAHAAIAVSPQYSMLRDMVPFEKRWVPDRDAVTWLYERPADPLPAVAEAVLFYDDRGDDGLHAAAILRDLPNAQAIQLPHAGHPVAAMLVETGFLSSVILDAAHGRLQPETLKSALRRERHRSGQYLFTLARRQPLWRLRLKARLAERAAATVPGEPVYKSYAGLVLECLGRHGEALVLHETATARPGYADGDMRLARYLWRAGRRDEACAAAERARDQLCNDLNHRVVFLAVDVHKGRIDRFLAARGLSGRMKHPFLCRRLLGFARMRLLGKRLDLRLVRYLAGLLEANSSLNPHNLLEELEATDRQ